MKLLDELKYGFARLFNRRPIAVKNSKVYSTAKVGDGAQLVNCSMGKYSYIYGSGATNTDIGAFCSIARGCSIGGGAHPTDWVSTSPVFYKGKNVLHVNFSRNDFYDDKKTVIGNDVWIGTDCIIKGGVTIGDGAIIGMGSVVTHDVPPYEIWAGTPARFIRKRFDDETISRLLETKWWEMSDEELFKCGDLFDRPKELLKYLEEQKK